MLEEREEFPDKGTMRRRARRIEDAAKTLAREFLDRTDHTKLPETSDYNSVPDLAARAGLLSKC
ncbi:MAG: hypothetical protein ABEL76_14385, partial [Bradymonadaceae bacterium]